MLEPLQRIRNAIIEGNLPIVKRILSRFSELWLNIDPKNQGWSNLHYASYYGHYLICIHLISYINKTLGSLEQHYTKLDLVAFDDTTVLHLCMEKKHAQTLHYLLQEFPGKIWLNSLGGSSRQTPLHYSCIHDFKEGTKLLLEFGAQWSIQDAHGDTCLHLCFQFGSVGCLYELLKYIIIHSKTKEDASEKIEELENVKNKQNWVAKDYSSSFDLITQYEEMKRDLLSQDYTGAVSEIKFSAESTTLPNSEVASIDTLGNKVLASPIVLMTLQQSVTNNDKNFEGRQHSQSLPSAFKAQPQPQPLVRQRSNTTYVYKPPAALTIATEGLTGRSPSSNSSPLSPMTPQPTTSNRAPSLKSVTISPSVRTNGTTNYNAGTDDEPISPQSAISTTSSFNASPNYKLGSRKKSFSFSKSVPLPSINSENVLWPSVNEEGVTESPPQQISPIKRSAADYKLRKNSSASSIAAKLAFNSSHSSPNHNEILRKRAASKSNSVHSNSLNSASSVSSSISSGSVSTIDTEIVRKARSSGTLPSSPSHKNNSHNNGIKIPITLNNNSVTSLNSNGSDNLKKYSVHSISFSRVR